MLLLSLVIFSFCLYFLLTLSIGDPALGVLRKNGVQNINHEILQQVRTDLGLSQSFLAQYAQWFLGILQGNFGKSFINDQDVLTLIYQRGQITFILVMVAFVISLLLSLILGCILGNFSKSNWVHLVDKILTVILSTPVYCIAILLIFLLGVRWQLFPFVGSGSIQHLVLPILVLTLSEGCYLTKMISDLISNIAQSERQLLLRFRGLCWYYRIAYQLKEISVPLITLYAQSFLQIFGISVMVEIMLSISGVGKLLMESIMARDYPVIQGITLLTATLTFVLHYFIDLVIEKIDDRIPIPERSD